MHFWRGNFLSNFYFKRKDILKRISGIVGLFLVLIGCTASNTMDLMLEAEAGINLDARGNPLPVVVRVYDLKSPESFQAASFHDLWKSDRAILGDSLVMMESVKLYPHSQKKITFPISEESHWIGVMAVFRHPKSGAWQLSQAIPPSYIRFINPPRVLIIGNALTWK